MRPLSLARTLLFSAANLGVNMVNALSNSALPLYLGAYGVPNILIGFLAQERSFIGGFVQPVIGAISDRTSTRIGKRKPFFLVGVPLTVATLVFLAAHPPMWAVLAIVPVFAFFLAVATDPYMALMPDIVPEEQRGRVGAVMAVFNMLGQVLILALAALFWERHEAWVFYMAGGGLVLTYMVTFFGVQEPPPVPVRRRRKLRIRPLMYIKNVLSYRELSKYVFALFFFWFGVGGISPFLTRFAVQVLGTSESTAFLLMVVAVLSTAIFSVPAGYAGDKWGKHKTLMAGVALFSATVLVGSQVQNAFQAGVVMAFIGVSNAVTTSLSFPFLADLMPKRRAGEFTGLGSLVWSLAQPIGSVLAGLSVDMSGTYRTSFVVAGLLLLVSYILLRTVHPQEPEEEPEASQIVEPEVQGAG